MDMGSEISHERVGIFTDRLLWLKDLMEKYRVTFMEICMTTKKVGQEDPRRVIHSLKVGLALMLVSLFYYSQTLYNSFGVSALWAVMTVIVVFEFSVGATLGKGLNRALATLVAGALGVGAHYLAAGSGKIGEPILLGIFVSLQAAMATFARFFPKIKARYDYGMVMFITTFCLVSVSSFRNSEILELAQRRLSTILIGASICVIVSVSVYPVWAGEDLQNLVALNIERLAVFLEEFGNEYFKTSEEKQLKADKAFMEGYKTVLNSGNIEETLANFARWEPSHGRFMYRHPWKHYLKVGRLTRECAYRIDALNAHLNTHTQMPTDICGTIQSTCMKMSLESGMALKEIAHAIKTMSKPSNSSKSNLSNLKIAAENLKSLLKLELWREVDFVQMIQVVTVASVLFELALCVEKIAEAVDELAVLAQFKSLDANVELRNIV